MTKHRIRQHMTVVAADDHALGFVSRVRRDGSFMITGLRGGCGYDHLVLPTWICEVDDEFVYLNKTSDYLAANWPETNDPMIAA